MAPASQGIVSDAPASATSITYLSSSSDMVNLVYIELTDESQYEPFNPCKKEVWFSVGRSKHIGPHLS